MTIRGIEWECGQRQIFQPSDNATSLCQANWGILADNILILAHYAFVPSLSFMMALEAGTFSERILPSEVPAFYAVSFQLLSCNWSERLYRRLIANLNIREKRSTVTMYHVREFSRFPFLYSIYQASRDDVLSFVLSDRSWWVHDLDPWNLWSVIHFL